MYKNLLIVFYNVEKLIDNNFDVQELIDNPLNSEELINNPFTWGTY